MMSSIVGLQNFGSLKGQDEDSYRNDKEIRW